MNAIEKALTKVFGSANERLLKKLWPIVDRINQLEPEIQKLTDSQLQAKTVEFRSRLSERLKGSEDIDPAARKAELEAAEKTFLAIRGMAGDTDEYRLFLGQVYYWLGRLEEGRALFEELLAANERSYGTLMAVSSTLREVGEDSLARQFTEEDLRTPFSAVH